MNTTPQQAAVYLPARSTQAGSAKQTKTKMKKEHGKRANFFTIHRFCKVTSTNDVLKQLAEKNAPEGTVVVAQTQTRGRGRMERIWISPEGNLYMSLLLRPSFSAKDMLKLTLLSACAVGDAVKKTASITPTLKWPNDILINGKKVCGILCEGSFSKDVMQYLIVGIGINVNADPKKYSSSFLIEPATLSHECGKKISLRRVEKNVLSSFYEHYDDAKKRGLLTVLEKWCSYPSTLDKKICVKTAADEITGTAVELDRNGFLILRTAHNKKIRITEGDVLHLS